MGNHPLGDDPHWTLLSCLPYHGPLAQGHPPGLDGTKGAQHLLKTPYPPSSRFVLGVLPPFACLLEKIFPLPRLRTFGKIES